MTNFLFVLSKNDNEALTRCCQFAKNCPFQGPSCGYVFHR